MLDALSASESYGDMPMMHIDHAILRAFDFEGGWDYQGARELNLDSRSVQSYVQRILRKLNLTSRVQAAVYASGRGLA